MNVARLRVLVGAVLACLVVAAPAAAAPVGTALAGAGSADTGPADTGPAGDSPAVARPAGDGSDGPPRWRPDAPARARSSDGVASGTGGDQVTAGARSGGASAGHAGGAPDSSADGTPTGRAAAADQLHLTQTLALTPERPGEIRVTLAYEVPARVTDLTTEVPADATVVETNGFTAAGETGYEWTGGIAGPSITYRLPPNVTGDGTGPFGTAGEYRFVDAGPWALVRIPSTPTTWRWRGPRTRLVRERTTAGPGATGDATAYLGEHAVHGRQAHGQQFRLVVPERASMAASPDDVLTELAAAADGLRVGERDERVFLVAAPTGEVAWDVRGLQTGPGDAWVRDDEGFDDAANVWIHEYLHTRQGWTASEGTRWVSEATATYYAALLALERGHVDYATFRSRLGDGTRGPQSTSILARPDTWRNGANYQKGALVAGALDRRIRLASDRRRSLQYVLRAMNRYGEPVGPEAFDTMVAEAGNASVREAARRYTTTEAVPSTWDRDAHESAFGATPAYLEVALADEHAVAGPYRNRSLRGPTVTVVPGETLTVGAVVRNAGGVADDHVTTFGVDGEPRATRSGRVDPAETEHLTYDHTFTAVGAHRVTVGDASLDVEVRRPAEASVTRLSVDRPTVDPGAPVTVTATVGNDAEVPGERTVTLRADGDPIATREVRLDAGERLQVAVTTSFDAPGRYRVDAGGDDGVTVVVEAPAASTATTTPTTVTGDGFGVAAALVGVALLAVGVRLAPGDGGVLGAGPRREQ